MLTSNFSYQLPDQAISRTPAEPRDSSRLLVSRSKNEVLDSTVLHLPDFLNSGDLVVVNNTKVLPARIPIVRKTGGLGEVFLLHRIDSGIWSALVKPSSKIQPGEFVNVNISDSSEEWEIEIGEDAGEGHRIVKFVGVEESLVIEMAGKVPLPPYLGDIEIPLERYQTMFARDDKSVAAPTAGLHFTPELIENLKAKNIQIVEVTLHVGVGTFRPIMSENIEDHKMHEERYDIKDDVWRTIWDVKTNGGKIVAVGTTSLRTIESCALLGKLSGSTDLYCYGNFDFKVADFLFTNFHQPESSLLVLLDAFMGSRWRDLYSYALENEYRFLSFGDAMMVGRKELGDR